MGKNNIFLSIIYAPVPRKSVPRPCMQPSRGLGFCPITVELITRRSEVQIFHPPPIKKEDLNEIIAKSVRTFHHQLAFFRRKLIYYQ